MGVKSLWQLLAPVGRPVQLENMEGKTMAIDSSIWIYQFQATMRDKEGRVLVNAHVLGFLRRITKLLYYGIKPVFVFDGGAPALKRNTLNQRREKKTGATESHARIAEKLLAAQLRQAAVQQAQGSSSNKKGKGKAHPDDEDVVYLEDIDPTMQKTPTRKPQPETPQSQASADKKAKFRDHDLYRLPEANLEANIAKASTSLAPDPRLATEAELRTFIEEMRPEDLDVTSPAFRELPTEVQYEIVGDLRLKSRQTSYVRLQNMLSSSRTPLDFSKQQIANLKRRNALTQQLLVTTDTIGSAHISIPVRVASERNKQYVLVKNTSSEGGWVLGIRDPTGNTAEKPIEIDQEKSVADQDKPMAAVNSDLDSEDEDMEEVQISDVHGATTAMDPDLRAYQAENALSAIERRQTMTGSGATPKDPHASASQALFTFDGDDIEDEMKLIDEDEDLLAIAIQESLEQPTKPDSNFQPQASSSTIPDTPKRAEAAISETPSRLETALSIGIGGMSRTPSGHVGRPPLSSSRPSRSRVATSRSELAATASAPAASSFGLFGQPTLLLGDDEPEFAPPEIEAPSVREPSPTLGKQLDAEAEAATLAAESSRAVTERLHNDDDGVELHTADTANVGNKPPMQVSAVPELISSDEDEDMEEVPVPRAVLSATGAPSRARSPLPTLPLQSPMRSPSPMRRPPSPIHRSPSPIHRSPRAIHHSPGPTQQPSPCSPSPAILPESAPRSPTLPSLGGTRVPSPSPVRSLPSPSQVLVHDDPEPTIYQEAGGSEGQAAYSDQKQGEEPIVGDEADEHQGQGPAEPPHEDFDAAHEMDATAEEGEFARFLSQVKGRDLASVRSEIDDEITSLRQQRTAAMRAAEDVTQQMVAQIMIMLRLFGIPYMTAPMEAEAQCAALVSLGLVSGVITDDSDAFLFGAGAVFRHMFNQARTVECFRAADLARELGLERAVLVRLALLLGSDYTPGLPGVGPVVAMELLREFPGEDGLVRFREWWAAVQTGRDGAESETPFRRRFKKRFKDLYIPPDWPDPRVAEAYFHPTVDESEEPFKWGLPDLDGLREFFYGELGWSQSKVDELLLPIISRMGKRGQAQTTNQQGTLNAFLDVAGETGAQAPRRRQAYASKRLQQVVSDFRRKRAGLAGEGEAENEDEGAKDGGEPPRKRRKTATGKGRGKTATTRKGKGKGRAVTAQTEEGSGEEGVVEVRPKHAATARAMKTTARTRKKGKKRAGESEDDEGFSEDDGDSDDNYAWDGGEIAEAAEETVAPPRPRPRPRPVRRSTANASAS